RAGSTNGASRRGFKTTLLWDKFGIFSGLPLSPWHTSDAHPIRIRVDLDPPVGGPRIAWMLEGVRENANWVRRVACIRRRVEGQKAPSYRRQPLIIAEEFPCADPRCADIEWIRHRCLVPGRAAVLGDDPPVAGQSGGRVARVPA